MYAIRSYYERQRVGPDHEVRPDPQSAGGTGEGRLAVVVTPHPDHGQQILAEAGEPAVPRVVGGPGLAGLV